MLGSSRTSNAAVQEYLTSLYDDRSARSHFADAGVGCLAVVGALDGDLTLRSTLSDGSRSADTKQAVSRRLFGGKVPGLSLDVLDKVLSLRWGSAADMVDATEEAGACLVLMGAEVHHRINAVEEELFRFGRAVDANPPLQMALTNPANSPEAKAGIVRSLLDGRAASETVILLQHVAGNLRGRRIQDAVTALSKLAAARHGRVVADVKSAVALSGDQQRRLASVLARLQGRPVELNLVIDPSVIGGIEVRIEDDVIDGTVATRLEQARRRLTS